jgi:serine/threonine protein kinase
MIPGEDVPVVVDPSVTTVENVAAARVFFETKYQKLLLEPLSPRSIRRKKFENKMMDLCLPHDERESARQQWNRAESDHLRQMRVLHASSVTRHRAKGVSIAGFDNIRVLGKGSFGVVRLVTERNSATTSVTANGHSHPRRVSGGPAISNVDGTAKHNLPTGKPLSDVFAMKVIRKSDMLRACQEGHLRAERDFLVGAEGSQWVVPLIASFQDNTNLYLVMEYMIGGDFLGLLLREDVLDEDVAK